MLTEEEVFVFDFASSAEEQCLLVFPPLLSVIQRKKRLKWFQVFILILLINMFTASKSWTQFHFSFFLLLLKLMINH